MSEQINSKVDLPDYAGILKLLPHRYPFLLIDAVEACEKEKKIRARKNVSFNEPFFAGHFPTEPVMPGVLQIEAMAQASCLLIYLSFEDTAGKRPAFTGIDKARFKSPVRPGDILTIECELTRFRRGFASLQCKAMAGEKVTAEAEITATMI